MEYRILGGTGVKVSRLCFGVMSFGGDADEATSGAMFKRCREVGINFLIAPMPMPAGALRRFWGA